MPEFDQGRGVVDAGSAPLKTPRKPIVPLKPEYVPDENAPDIVKEAFAKDQKALQKQVDTVQTQGKQAGYTKAACEDIVNR